MVGNLWEDTIRASMIVKIFSKILKSKKLGSFFIINTQFSQVVIIAILMDISILMKRFLKKIFSDSPDWLSKKHEKIMKNF